MKSFEDVLKTKNMKVILKVLETPVALCRGFVCIEALVFSTGSENDLAKLTCKYIFIINCFFSSLFLFGHQPQTI